MLMERRSMIARGPDEEKQLTAEKLQGTCSHENILIMIMMVLHDCTHSCKLIELYTYNW